ncbi:MAG: PEP-CTERM sorting domain-containing protein [Chthoniobacterales bacterium]
MAWEVLNLPENKKWRKRYVLPVDRVQTCGLRKTQPYKNMKKILLTICAIATLTAINASAAISYDGFGYTIGNPLPGNVDWTSLNTGTPPGVIADNLTVDGLAAPTGNKVSYSAGNIQEALGALNTFNSGTVFFSIAFQLTSQPTVSAYAFALATGNTNYGATVWIQAAGAGFNFGVANRSNSTPTYDTVELSLNTTYFIVASYTFNAGTNDDSSSLWINPASSNFEAASAPTPTLTVTGGNDLVQINQFLIRGVTGSGAGEVDELRVGTTWASVTPVPEPGTVALVGLGLGTVLFGVRRRRA